MWIDQRRLKCELVQGGEFGEATLGFDDLMQRVVRCIYDITSCRSIFESPAELALSFAAKPRAAAMQRFSCIRPYSIAAKRMQFAVEFEDRPYNSKITNMRATLIGSAVTR